MPPCFELRGTHVTAALERQRKILLLECYCAHCWRPFRRAMLITGLCGACEDEGHEGPADACDMCTNNALDGTQRRVRVCTTCSCNTAGGLI